MFHSLPPSPVYLTLKPNFKRTAVISKNESEPHLLFEEGGSRLITQKMSGVLWFMRDVPMGGLPMLVDTLSHLRIDHRGIATLEDHGDGFALRFAGAGADDATIVDHGGETLCLGVGHCCGSGDVAPLFAVEAALPLVGARRGTRDDTCGEEEGVLVIDDHTSLAGRHGDGDTGIDREGTYTSDGTTFTELGGATQIVGAGIGGYVFYRGIGGTENGLP